MISQYLYHPIGAYLPRFADTCQPALWSQRSTSTWRCCSRSCNRDVLCQLECQVYVYPSLSNTDRGCSHSTQASSKYDKLDMRTHVQNIDIHGCTAGEAQKIDRIMEKFAERFCRDNPGAFASADAAYILAFALIMLNTDAHNPQAEKKIARADFVNMSQFQVWGMHAVAVEVCVLWSWRYACCGGRSGSMPCSKALGQATSSCTLLMPSLRCVSSGPTWFVPGTYKCVHMHLV